MPRKKAVWSMTSGNHALAAVNLEHKGGGLANTVVPVPS